MTLVGLSFGGWLAAEIAVQCGHRVDRLVLVDALGIKISDRETPDILDVFNTSPQEVQRRSWHDPGRGRRIFNAMSDDELVVRARNWEALCLYGWHPYMYNPQLKRWLRRIAVPTLVLWGASDGIVKPSYGQAYSRADPGFALRADRARGTSSRDRAARAFVDTCRGVAESMPRLEGREPMEAWWQCEIPYPFVPRQVLDAAESVRGSLPNRYCDPRSPPICSRRSSTSSCCATTWA